MGKVSIFWLFNLIVLFFVVYKSIFIANIKFFNDFLDEQINIATMTTTEPDTPFNERRTTSGLFFMYMQFCIYD